LSEGGILSAMHVDIFGNWNQDTRSGTRGGRALQP